jgi:AcrR family transcriptional regulator
MAVRRVETPEVRRSQIIAAARELIIEKGYSEVLLDDVAHRAGVAKGTLYLYFADKPHLYGAVMEGLLDEVAVRLKKAVDIRGDDPLVPVRAAVSEMLAFTDVYKDVFVACGQARADLGRKINHALRNRLERHIDLLGGIVQAAARRRALRHHDPKTGGMFLIALTRMFMMRKLFQDRREPLVECTDEFMDLLCNGLGSGKGKRS